MTEEIYAPNIHLFAFHAQKYFTVGSETIDPKPTLLWKQYRQIAQKFLITPARIPVKPDDFPATRADILATDKVFQLLQGKLAPNSNQPIPIQGLAYPLWLYDSYVLALAIYRPQKEGSDAVEISRLADFNPDGCFLPSTIQSNLGQTLLITAFLSPQQQQKSPDALRQLADKCYRSFTGAQPSQILEFNQDSTLFGSPIFEYSIPGQPSQYGNVLIWFFFSEPASEKFVDNYRDFTDLFFYRRKVIYSYSNSKNDYKIAVEKCKAIEKEISELKAISDDSILDESKLKDLKKKVKTLLQTAVEYSQLQRNLEYYRTTIEINSDNYKEKLKLLQKKLQKHYNLGGEELEFLETFSQRDCRKYQEQIAADLNYLRHGSELLDKAISTIRGIVEIDQAERDRAFQNTIQTVGAGIGAGIGAAQLFLGSYAFIKPEDPLLFPGTANAKFIHPFVASILWSILVGVVLGLATWGLTSTLLNKSPKKKP